MNLRVATLLYVGDPLQEMDDMSASLARIGSPMVIRSVCSMESAVDYLVGLGPASNRGANPFPQILLLDLQSLERSLALLDWVRSDIFLRPIFIAVFVTEKNAFTFASVADALLRKPAADASLASMVARADAFVAANPPALSRQG